MRALDFRPHASHRPRSLARRKPTPLPRRRRSLMASATCATASSTLSPTSARLLGKIGYQTLEAGGGEEALELYRGNPNISVVVLDLTMPGLSGQQTLKKLREINPGVRCLLASGYSSTGLEGIEGEHFIQKPFTLDKLRMALQQLD